MAGMLVQGAALALVAAANSIAAWAFAAALLGAGTALVAGVLADAFGVRAALWVVAGITAASGVLVAHRMYETLQTPREIRTPLA